VQLILEDTANIFEPGFVVDVVMVRRRHVNGNDVVSPKVFSWYVRPFLYLCENEKLK